MTEINFPVYRLGSKPYIIDNVWFYLYHTNNTDTNELSTTVRIVDDKNIKQPTLAKRRLELLKQGVPLRKINRAIFFLGDFIKLAKKHVWFIDSLGNVFEYEKTKSVPLIFKKVTNILPVKTGGVIVEVDGIISRFKTLYTPNYYPRYAGLLEFSPKTYILYGLFSELPKTTRRKI